MSTGLEKNPGEPQMLISRNLVKSPFFGCHGNCDFGETAKKLRLRTVGRLPRGGKKHFTKNKMMVPSGEPVLLATVI